MRIQRVGVAVAAFLLAPPQSGILKPQVTPIFFEQRAPAFLLECRNATGASIRPIRTMDMMRLDGQVEANSGGSAHSGDEPPLIAPGGSWKEVVVLRASRLSTGGNPGLGAIFMFDTTVAMIPGRHTVAFQCGGTWSDESAFYWAESPH